MWMSWLAISKCFHLIPRYAEKTADIWRLNYWFPNQMISEKCF